MEPNINIAGLVWQIGRGARECLQFSNLSGGADDMMIDDT